jgi:hypothetical protein
MSPAEEYAICSRCQLADCDDKSAACGLRQSRPVQIERHLRAIEAQRHRRVESALRAIRQQQSAA